MSEKETTFVQDTPQQTPVGDTAAMTAGAMLRQAREASGLHIAALAVSLKVPVKKLEALEADRFDLLPDVVFVRALAASVCRTLRIDPAPIMARLPDSMTPRLKSVAQGSRVSPNFQISYGNLPFFGQFSKPLGLALLLLLVGMAVLLFFPSQPTAPTLKVTPVEPIINLPATLPLPPASAYATVASPIPGASATSGVEASVGAVNSASVVAGSGLTTGLVVLKATAPSWVEVVDARGIVQVRKTLQVGEVLGASGNLPLSVVLGRADAVQVQVRGQAFDVKALAKDNVARFEVK